MPRDEKVRRRRDFVEDEQPQRSEVCPEPNLLCTHVAFLVFPLEICFYWNLDDEGESKQQKKKIFHKCGFVMASKAENWTVVYVTCHQKTWQKCLNQSPAGWKCSCLQTQCTPEATHESMGWCMPGCGIGPRGWPASTHKLDPWQGCYTAFVFRGCAPLTVHPTLKSLFGSIKISSHRVCLAFILMWTPELLWLRFGAVWDECKGLLRFSISTLVWRERCKNDK